jgi:hypothetical protein
VVDVSKPGAVLRHHVTGGRDGGSVDVLGGAESGDLRLQRGDS